MRGSPSDQLASIGVNNVWTAFNRIGWAPAENVRHDRGTDLFVEARDRRLFSIGAVVLVQVKTGPSQFARPARDEDGKTTGWWFRDRDRRHLDDWSSYVLPYLLVLHDADEEISYWVHVTRDAIKSTGVGARILVPRANTLDVAHADALLRVAASTRPGVPLEGTAWTGGQPAKPSDELRFALLVPRLIAPHPSYSQAEPLSPAQAIAMLMQARLQQLNGYAQASDAVPTLDDALESPEWKWRFYGALGQQLVAETLEPLRSSLADAPDAPSRTAAAVTLASGLLGLGRPQEALATLDAVLVPDEAFPVDDAWLRVQRARALVDIGDVDEARREASAVQLVRTTSGDDVTATALQGVAAGILFDHRSWSQRDVALLLEGADRAARWWRNEGVARGVTAVAQRVFKGWARDRTITIVSTDEANDQLYVAALNAGHLGDHGAWRSLTSLLGQDGLLRLDRRADPSDVVESIGELRLAGDAQAIEKAIGRLLDDGPLIAVRAAAGDVVLAQSTRTTIGADLALLRCSGDVLDAETAERAFDWLESVITDPKPLTTLTRPGARDVRLSPLECLAEIAAAAPERAIATALRHLSSPELHEPDFIVTAWTRLVSTVPDDAWTRDALDRLAEFTIVDSTLLRWPVLALRAVYNERARATLVAAASEGRPIAFTYLAALLPIGEMDRELAHAVLPELVRTLERIRADARKGQATLDRREPANDLALIVVAHPDKTAFGALLDFLDDPLVGRRFKGQALFTLAQHIESIDPAWHSRLLEIARTAPETRPSLDNPHFSSDIDGQAAFLAGMIDPKSSPRYITQLLGGPTPQRIAAAHLAASTEDTAAVLLALVSDEHPAVRAAAAAAAARRLAKRTNDQIAELVVRQAAADTGRQAPLALARAFADVGAPTTTAREVLETLRRHNSASVRATARTAAAMH